MLHYKRSGRKGDVLACELETFYVVFHHYHFLCRRGNLLAGEFGGARGGEGEADKLPLYCIGGVEASSTLDL